jgi:hypothetical protein
MGTVLSLFFFFWSHHSLTQIEELPIAAGALMKLDQMLPTELRRTWAPKEINKAGNSHDRSGFQFQIQMWNCNQSGANYLANHMPLEIC